MLQKNLLERIEKRFGRPLRYPEETVALSQAIFDATHEYLSASTLKRMFGWLCGSATHRGATLDILAKYLGYDSFAALKEDISNDASLSPEGKPTALHISVGDTVRISSSAGWLLTLKHEGDGFFSVVSPADGIAEADDGFIIRKVG